MQKSPGMMCFNTQIISLKAKEKKKKKVPQAKFSQPFLLLPALIINASWGYRFALQFLKN